jgi:hypothetical protein
MTTLKIKTILKQIKDGKIEMMQDLKIGYVEIRNTTSGKRQIIEITN